MKLKDAILAMFDGKKVRHKDFNEEEYLFYCPKENLFFSAYELMQALLNGLVLRNKYSGSKLKLVDGQLEMIPGSVFNVINPPLDSLNRDCWEICRD